MPYATDHRSSTGQPSALQSLVFLFNFRECVGDHHVLLTEERSYARICRIRIHRLAFLTKRFYEKG